MICQSQNRRKFWTIERLLHRALKMLKRVFKKYWKNIEFEQILKMYWKGIEKVFKGIENVLKMKPKALKRYLKRYWKGINEGYWKGIERILERYWKNIGNVLKRCAEKVWTIKCSFRISIKQVWSENKLNLRKLVKMYIDWICIHKESTQSQTNVKGIS